MPESTNTPAPQPTTDNKNTSAAPQVGGIGGAPKAPEPPKSLKIKGVEFKSEDDAFAEIERGRQSGKLLTEAQKRLFEASKKEKDWEGLVGEVKTKKDARRVIEKLGLSKEEAVEIFGRYIYENEVLPKELDPKERRIRELEAEAAARKERDEQDRRSKQEQELEVQTRQEEARLKDELTKLLQSKKFPNTRIALRRLANYLSSYADAGANIPADRAADMVMEDYKQEYGELFGEASADQIAEFLGEKVWLELCKKVSGWALARAGRGANITAVKAAVPSRKPAEKEEKLSPQEFYNFIRSQK